MKLGNYNKAQLMNVVQNTLITISLTVIYTNPSKHDSGSSKLWIHAILLENVCVFFGKSELVAALLHFNLITYFGARF